MQPLLNIYKPVGLTPLEAIKKVRQQNPEFAKVKIGYAGRLDPLAHGVLLLMVGEETKKREQYLSLPKIYEFEVVFGIATDTYDILGYLNKVETKLLGKNVNLFVNTFVNNAIGKKLQSYPPYSSKTVEGKPLFQWAKNNQLDKIEIPKKEVEIFDFRCLSKSNITRNELQKKVQISINLVHGDFRQKEILERWEHFFSLETNINSKLQTTKFYLSCSSGTYVRELVHQLGKEIGCGAVAIDILRTAVGDYTLKDSVKLI